jgi:hypothetical protein
VPDYTIEDVVRFARARHRIWEGKGTKSRILTTRKFTNVFRVLDRGSQYLLALMNVYQENPLDQVALSYFYRQVNRPDTMDAIIELNDGFVPSATEIFDPVWYDDVVRPVAEARPGSFLSGAYMILISPGDKRPTVDKMQDMFTRPQTQNLLGHVAETEDLALRVQLLDEITGIGEFMAMQIATDLGYCEGQQDLENTYVVAGPGSKMGVGFLLGKPYATKQEAQHVIQNFPFDQLPALPYSNGRPASWMDVQNVFCEFSKYVRMRERGDKGAPKPYVNKEPFETHIPTHFKR